MHGIQKRAYRWILLGALLITTLSGTHPGCTSAAVVPPTPGQPSAIQSTSPLIAIDQRTHHVFACDRGYLLMADEIRGTSLPMTAHPCAGILIDGATHHGFIFDGQTSVTMIDTHDGATLARAATPAISPLGAIFTGGHYVVSYAKGLAGLYPGTQPPGLEPPGLGIFAPIGAPTPPWNQYGVLDLDPHSGGVVPDPSLDPSNEPILATDGSTGRLYLSGPTAIDVVAVATGERTQLTMTSQEADDYYRVVVTDGQAGHVFVGRLVQVPNNSAKDSALYIDVYDLATQHRIRTIYVDQNGDNEYFAMAIDPVRGMLAVVPFFGDPQLYRINWRTGAVFAPLPVPYAWPTVAIDSATGRIYGTSVPAPHRDDQLPYVPGNFYSIDAKRGTVLSAQPIGYNAQALAVDDVAGRVFTASAGIWMMDGRLHPGKGGAPLPTDPVAPQRGMEQQYFPQTHHTLSGAFLHFWQQYGGIGIFGYPETEPFSDGTHLVQFTDRFALMLVHGQVQTAPLGRQLRQFPGATRALTGRFLAFWQQHHGAKLLGAPISDAFYEGNNDGSGRRYLLQWFQRGRLEYHPENHGTPYEMQLGLVGIQALRRYGWLPTPSVVPLSALAS